MNQYAQILAEILMAAYLYYYQDATVLTDAEFDGKVMYLRSQKRQYLANKLDSLIDWDSFQTSTSLSYIKWYPEPLKRIALKWLELYNEITGV